MTYLQFTRSRQARQPLRALTCFHGVLCCRLVDRDRGLFLVQPLDLSLGQLSTSMLSRSNRSAPGWSTLDLCGSRSLICGFCRFESSVDPAIVGKHFNCLTKRRGVLTESAEVEEVNVAELTVSGVKLVSVICLVTASPTRKLADPSRRFTAMNGSDMLAAMIGDCSSFARTTLCCLPSGK